MTAQVLRPRPAPTVNALLSDRHSLGFGGLPLGQSAQQSLTIKNNTSQSVKVRLEIRQVSALASVDYQLVSCYMHKMTYTTSKEVLLAGDEELLLTVNFRPSSVGCIDAAIIRLVHTQWLWWSQ